MIPSLLLAFAAVAVGNTTGALPVTTSGSCPNFAAPGIVFPWLAEANGLTLVKLTGSYDTVLAMRTESGLQLTCNDDAVQGDWTKGSTISFEAVAGTLYNLVVTGYKGEGAISWQGTFLLEVDAPAAAGDACPKPPFFDLDGPVCTAAREVVVCGCSEAISWDPAPRAEWYEVMRVNPDNSTLAAGDTRPHHKAECTQLDGEGECMTWRSVPIEYWLPEWDSELPHAGLTYGYRVKACAAAGCSAAWSDPPVRYAAAPMACYTDKEIICYPGDALANPFNRRP